MIHTTIGILSPGDMGAGVGASLKKSGIDTVTFVGNRSLRTRKLAEKAEFRLLESMETLVRECDLILSILVPAEAEHLASEVSRAIRATQQKTFFADCNAISPDKSQRIAKLINDSGGQFIDGGIIGGSPARGDMPRFYVSGPDVKPIMNLDGKGIMVRHLGDSIGTASGIKMCYAALTKGTNTLQTALLTAAELMGITNELRDEFASSQAPTLEQMDSGIFKLPPNSHRWIGEMEEIADTFSNLGITPLFHQGAAEIYKLLSQTDFAKETPENINSDRTTSETIQAVVSVLNNKKS